MGILDAPGLTTAAVAAQIAAQPISTASRLSSLLSRFAGPNTPAVPAVAPAIDIPTVAWNTTSAFSGTYQVVGPQTGLVTEVGSRGTWLDSQARLNVSGVAGLDFFFTGTTLELWVNTNATSTTYSYWIWVNGAPIAIAPDNSQPTNASMFYVSLTFPSSARRRIEFFAPTIVASWYGIRTAITSLITPSPRRPVVGFVGDSFFDQAAASTLQCQPFQVSRMLGVECFSKSLGGTGYVAVGAFNTFGSAARVASVAPGNPELIIFQGSVNDDSSSAASIQAAATACYAAYAVACPRAKLIVFGPQPNAATSTLSAARTANNAAVRAAAVAAPNVLAFHDEIGTASGVTPPAYNASTTQNDGDLCTYLGSVWRRSAGGVAGSGATPGLSNRQALVTYVFTGTGKVGSVVGDGTRDTYLYSDSVHPTVEGCAALAIRTANAVRDDLSAASLT